MSSKERKINHQWVERIWREEGLESTGKATQEPQVIIAA
jgi:hypothetical protein